MSGGKGVTIEEGIVTGTAAVVPTMDRRKSTVFIPVNQEDN